MNASAPRFVRHTTVVAVTVPQSISRHLIARSSGAARALNFRHKLDPSNHCTRLSPLTRGMASSTPASANGSSNKAIFAPGADPSGAPSQADQYLMGQLDSSDLSPSPLTQFSTWFNKARESHVHQPETVCLSTASLPSGRVSSRMVYLKELDSRGFVIYSNWGTSRKSADVNSNAHASLCFWWREQERQVRVDGPVERLSDAESQVYFDTRARGSRMGAWASQQSAVLAGREQLEGQVKGVEQRFDGQEHVPVPPFWGGLRVLPEYIEFWQGRESRLHDRFAYRRVAGKPGEEDKGEGTWTVERLSP